MWRVLKDGVLDSTHVERKRAMARVRQLRASLRRKRDPDVTMVEAEAGDPVNYRRPRGGPWTNYDRPFPWAGAGRVRK